MLACTAAMNLHCHNEFALLKKNAVHSLDLEGMLWTWMDAALQKQLRKHV